MSEYQNVGFGLINGGDAFLGVNQLQLIDVLGVVKPQQSANSSDVFAQGFGDKANTSEFQTVRSQWAIGDFSQLPSIQILSAANQKGAFSANASSNETVHLSDTLFQNSAAPANSLLDATGVLIKETFHWLDNLVEVDTKGDKGELARNFLFNVPLSNFGEDRIVGKAKTAAVTIADTVTTDAPPTITIAATDANAAETNAGQVANPGRFTLTRTGSTANALTVKYTATGTAIPGIDYSNLLGPVTSGTVTFAAGSSSAIVDINPINDSSVESAESVILSLASGTGYQLGTTKTATVTIADNDVVAPSTNDAVVPSTYKPFNASQVFSLNSNAGANHTIYLDFDGHTTTGTFWNYMYGSSIVTDAYDTDGNTSTFSASELENIWNIWRRVAEDFIPFNVNVTTAIPSTSDLIKSGSGDTRWGIRAAIGGNGSWYHSAGGTAFLDSFNWDSDTPAFVFSKNLSGGNVKAVAEAVSHEVGHALGLDHDGKTNVTDYYTGHNGWASIMGVGYDQGLTQWSKGEYSGASNTQDDLAILTGNNGFGYRTDDYGSSLTTASNLSFIGSTVQTHGIIERNTDSDWLAFNSVGGNLALNVNAFGIGANLDILVKLYNDFGQLIATYNPTDSLSVSISQSLSAGKYYLSVEGTGKGDLVTGYSNYGSLGQYSITGTIA